MKRWLTSAAYLTGRAGFTARPRLSAGADPLPDPAAEQLTAWLARLRLLHGVPFHYLLPDQRMLPVESIRFFSVDPNWITALLDGAFSLGRSTTGETPLAAQLGQDLLARATRHGSLVRAGHLGLQATPADIPVPPEMSGFLLRSGVVAGWPTMEVQALDATAAPLLPLRLERAAGNILFGLFAGRVQQVKFREPAETLHFGFELPAASGAPLTKGLKYLDVPGQTTGAQLPDASVAVPLRDATRRVVNVLDLQAQLRSALLAHGGMPADGQYTAAQFALEMVQGVQEIDFTIS